MVGAFLRTKDEEQWHQVLVKLAAHTSLSRLIVPNSTWQLCGHLLVDEVGVEVWHAWESESCRSFRSYLSGGRVLVGANGRGGRESKTMIDGKIRCVCGAKCSERQVASAGLRPLSLYALIHFRVVLQSRKKNYALPIAMIYSLFCCLLLREERLQEIGLLIDANSKDMRPLDASSRRRHIRRVSQNIITPLQSKTKITNCSTRVGTLCR